MSKTIPTSNGWPRAIVRAAHLHRLRGPVLEAALPDVRIGERCVIRAGAGRRDIVGHAQVIGFSDHGAVLALSGAAHGLSRAVVLEPTGRSMQIAVSDALLGTVVDATGHVLANIVGGSAGDVSEGTYGAGMHDEKAKGEATDEEGADREEADEAGIRRRTRAPRHAVIEWREIDVSRVTPKQPVSEPFETGVRVIDGVLRVGVGQRVAVLAGAGVGKTSLLHMIASAPTTDVVVMALVGERGREVSEAIERWRASARADRIVIVSATSDAPPVERAAAAAAAMTIAEYFRDRGRHVVLIVDSLTRYARALREIALSAGELPARHGYPPSVFERLPRLLERAGRVGAGAITAFFSVLVEDEETLDPIAHEVVSILDGHFVLSRRLAGEGHFPAVDIARSVSRVAAHVAEPDDLARAAAVRRVLARAEELAVLVDMGEYRAGASPDDDRALLAARRLREGLSQTENESSSIDDARKVIDAAFH